MKRDTGDRPVRSHRASLPPPERLDHVHVKKSLRFSGWGFPRTCLHRDSVGQRAPTHSCSSGPFSKFRVCRQHHDGLRELSAQIVDCLLCPLSFLAQTLYNVRAEISPPPGTEHCRTGSLCSLDVSITRLSDLLEVDKDEALTESDEYFSTKLMYEGGSGGFLALTVVLGPVVHNVQCSSSEERTF